MSANTGGPAFPGLEGGRPARGMMLRDWFAGMAMQGIVDHNFLSAAGEQVRVPMLAEACYAIADAMLKAREG